VAVFAALILLTLLTAWLGATAQLGAWEIPVALGIATVKTLLVGLFFMHLIHSSKLTWLVILSALLALAIMLALTLVDYWTRPYGPVSLPPPTSSAARLDGSERLTAARGSVGREQ